MKPEDLLERLPLENKHFEWTHVNVPRVDPGVYNTLGRRLFDLYQKYKIDSADQREMEALNWVLHSFTMTQKVKPWWKRWM